MKKLITILAALFVCANSIIQAQDCLWAKSAEGNKIDSVLSACTDVNGNVFVTGFFRSSTINFGTITLTNPFTSWWDEDIFIIKYAPDGTVLWANSAGGNNTDIGSGISTDANGNVFVTGFFYSESISFGTTTLTNGGGGDIFIAKYDPNGNVIWAKSEGGTSFDLGNCVSTDTNGNLYVTGSFDSPYINFGATLLTNTGNDGYSDIFIAKYDPDGTVLWAKSSEDANYESNSSICNDANGNVYFTTGFYNTTITIGTTTLINEGVADIIIVKLSSDGEVLWAKSVGGTEADFCYSISVDNNGNVFIAGAFYSPVLTFGAISITNSNNTNTSDVFIAKYDSNGNVLWANSAGGNSEDYSNDISTDGDGNLYLTGNFYSNNITFGTTTLTHSDENIPNSFIVKYDPNGSVLWTIPIGSSGYTVSTSICTDAYDNLFIAGSFYSPSITIGNNSLTNLDNGGSTTDIFIAKFGGTVTGLNETLANKQLNISPNPTNSSITLTMPSQRNSNVSITTLTGTEVGNYTTQNTSTQTIDISHLASGVYFVSLKSEEGVLTKKIIKQ